MRCFHRRRRLIPNDRIANAIISIFASTVFSDNADIELRKYAPKPDRIIRPIIAIEVRMGLARNSSFALWGRVDNFGSVVFFIFYLFGANKLLCGSGDVVICNDHRKDSRLHYSLKIRHSPSSGYPVTCHSEEW
jgi:hypothetical protein